MRTRTHGGEGTHGEAWMLFSCSSSCSELKVFLLVVFDPTEIPYSCQRKGDPTGIMQPQSYQHDVILSLYSPSLSLSLYPSLPLSICCPSSLLPLPSLSSLPSFLSCAVIMCPLRRQSSTVQRTVPLFCNVNQWESKFVLLRYNIFLFAVAPVVQHLSHHYE